MPALTLIIGDHNLSSWSLRPWILLKHLGLPFQQIKLTLHSDAPGAEQDGYAREFRRRIAEYSPAGRVPVLLHDGLKIWDSMAICEYLNELSGGAAWPADTAQRAHARSVSAEMHSGFQALRQLWSMNTLGRDLQVPLTQLAATDVSRISQIWTDCRASASDQGPWLFGRYSIADAMYAPVALRFNTYGAKLPARAAEYLATVLGDPPMQQWFAEAAAEIASP